MRRRVKSGAAPPRRARVRPTVVLVPLGCDKNTVDGEKILGRLHEGGYLIEDAASIEARRRPLDLLVVNTCAFIGPARDESLGALRAAARLKEAGRCRRIAVSGCFGPWLKETLPEDLREAVDVFIGPGDIHRAYEIVEGLEEARFRPPARSLQAGPRLLTRSSGTAFVKIAEGCDRSCSFCTIPRLRGPFRSRSVRSVVAEIRSLVEAGVKEVVLVSQDTTSFGVDRGTTLVRLVEAIGGMRAAERPVRVRLHYLHPARVTRSLVAAIASSPVVAPYFDIPIQHADPRVLRAMKRPADPDRILRLTEEIRARFPECAIRSTVITGHPGETAAAFRYLLAFLERVRFDRLGAIPYSPEPGTDSFRMKDPGRAEERAAAVMELQAGISRERLKLRVGKRYDVLMDTETTGRTVLEAPDVDGTVRIEGRQGCIQPAVITGSDDHDLEARPA